MRKCAGELRPRPHKVCMDSNETNGRGTELGFYIHLGHKKENNRDGTTGTYFQ